ncbi:uncharacterized protein ASCRUDRAFT_16016 [Ascoidea rubescens DSM 1968]|uniref:Uncharacterized protein n=1 Tax=Ascoidea rubescens DSM 1968 TaxID=1344418 RepID=A0A1D2V8Q2_9ASCO|nr:hypothetical protein ASCRUDRAFT_16016 [Ascoidea rubescens DSM 1968]ODV57875.1 hypothetical protein ASCRUDRAFT_16016 [Ascoidea rubescens DSM 1968]
MHSFSEFLEEITSINMGVQTVSLNLPKFLIELSNNYNHYSNSNFNYNYNYNYNYNDNQIEINKFFVNHLFIFYNVLNFLNGFSKILVEIFETLINISFKCSRYLGLFIISLIVITILDSDWNYHYHCNYNYNNSINNNNINNDINCISTG